MQRSLEKSYDRNSLEKNSPSCQECETRKGEKSKNKPSREDIQRGNHNEKNQRNFRELGENHQLSHGQSDNNSTYRTFETKIEEKDVSSLNFLTSSCHQTPTLKNLETVNPNQQISAFTKPETSFN